MKDIKKGREGIEAFKDILLPSYMYVLLDICLWACSRDFDFFQFFSVFFFEYYSMLRLSSKGLVIAVTLRYSPDRVPCLRDRQHNNLSGSPLALMEKRSLALQPQTAEGPCSVVLCCRAWVRVTISRLRENCWNSVAEELHGASHRLSSLAVSICFFPIIFRTGSQKWIWKDTKLDEWALESFQMPLTQTFHKTLKWPGKLILRDYFGLSLSMNYFPVL